MTKITPELVREWLKVGFCDLVPDQIFSLMYGYLEAAGHNADISFSDTCHRIEADRYEKLYEDMSDCSFNRGWIDIASAPKDEFKNIILCDTKGEPYVGYWIDNIYYTGWRSIDDSQIDINPTHWMKLPEKPQPPGGAE